MGGRKGGRKRKPTILHLLEGGRKKTHRPLPENEPHPPAEIPKCPRHLDKEARKEWRRMAKELGPLGLLTGLDKAVFASYCQAWSTWVAATLKVQEVGMVVKASTGTPMMNPYLPIVNKANEQMMKALVEIGMSPSSRSRVKVPNEKPKSKIESFMGRKNGTTE